MQKCFFCFLFFAKLRHSLTVHTKRCDTKAVTLVHIFVYNLHLDTGVGIPFLSASQCSLAPVNGTVRNLGKTSHIVN